MMHPHHCARCCLCTAVWRASINPWYLIAMQGQRRAVDPFIGVYMAVLVLIQLGGFTVPSLSMLGDACPDIGSLIYCMRRLRCSVLMVDSATICVTRPRRVHHQFRLLSPAPGGWQADAPTRPCSPGAGAGRQSPAC